MQHVGAENCFMHERARPKYRAQLAKREFRTTDLKPADVFLPPNYRINDASYTNPPEESSRKVTRKIKLTKPYLYHKPFSGLVYLDFTIGKN